MAAGAPEVGVNAGAQASAMPRPLRVAAFTCGWTYTSARFRVRQYLPDLADLGIGVREHVAPIYKHHIPRSQHPLWRLGIKVARPTALMPSIAASHRADASWIQKEMIWGRDTLERFTKRPRLFDVDDAVWVPREGASEHMARLAARMDVVIAGNDVIADWFGRYCSDVRIVHTAIDTDRFRPLATPGQPDRPFTIVWTGQRATLYHLALIEPALRVFMTRHPDVRFAAVSDVPPEMQSLPAGRTSWIPWDADTEMTSIQGAHVGVMPLVDDENGRAKCSFKMLQYMSCAIPSVVTPIGLNRDILASGDVGVGATTTDEWVDGLEQLYADRRLAESMGAAARELAVSRFDRTLIAGQLAAIFRDVVETD